MTQLYPHGPVTDRDTAHRTPHTAGAATEDGNRAQRARARARVADETALTQGDLWGRLGSYWTPPEVWARPPASLTEILRYAREGEWTTVDSFARYLGVLYSYLAVAGSACCYYAAWVIQRPGRLSTFLLIYFLLSRTSWLGWLPWPW